MLLYVARFTDMVSNMPSHTTEVSRVTNGRNKICMLQAFNTDFSGLYYCDDEEEKHRNSPL